MYVRSKYECSSLISVRVYMSPSVQFERRRAKPKKRTMAKRRGKRREGEAKGEMRVREWRGNSCAVRDCSAFEGSRTSHRLYMHDPEDGKASWTKLIPVVLISNAEGLSPPTFCPGSVWNASWLITVTNLAVSYTGNTNSRLRGNAIGLEHPIYIYMYHFYIVVLTDLAICFI